MVTLLAQRSPLMISACIVVTLAFAVASAEQETSNRRSVPPEAITLAESILRDQWKVEVAANPAAYLVDGIDVSQARLGKPFFLLELRGSALDSFVAADKDDAREFPALEKYCFPILLPDGGDAGVLIVMRNRDETRQRLLHERGEFIPFGYLGRGVPILSDVDRLRRDFPGNSDVYLVRYEGGGIPDRYLVQNDLGTLLSGTSTRGLKPLAEDARIAREGIRSYQETLRSVKDRP